MKRHIVILGGGVGGLATAFFLGAMDGIRVTLVEREPAHDRHSSGRSAEILRTAIEDDVTRELALMSAGWLRVPETIGLRTNRPLVDERGLVVLTPEDGARWVAPHLEAGLAQELQRAELEGLAPMFRPEGPRVFYLHEGGRIDRDELLRALAQGAAARGVRVLRSAGHATPLVEGGRVAGVDIEAKDGRLTVTCDRLVVAAGAWSGELGDELGAPLPLRTTRRHMFVARGSLEPPRDLPVIWDDVAALYLRPESSVEGRLDWAFSTTDLDEFDLRDLRPDGPRPYAVDGGIERAALTELGARVKAGPFEIVERWRGFRDLTPDDRPILGADPRVSDLFWCTGLGGHGMTVSLAVGDAAARAAAGRASHWDASCSPGRFGG